jgi:predicted transcriptional regulator YdeE
VEVCKQTILVSMQTLLQVEDVSDGMIVWEVCEQLCAVFSSTIQTVEKTFQGIEEGWPADAEFEPIDGMRLEQYTEESDTTGELKVWIPVRPKDTSH